MANFVPGVVRGLRAPADHAPEFEATAVAIGINVAVDVPEEVSRWFGGRGHAAVLGTLDGTGIRGTLVPCGGGRHRLFLNTGMREATGTAVGDTVRLRLWRDAGPRTPEVPEDVRGALEAAGVLEAFLSWPPSHRREYLVAIEDAKTDATRRRRIERTVAAAAAR